MIALVAALAGYPIYVAPSTDAVTKADAVVVLGGAPYERFEYGISLAEQGYAPEVLISNSVGEQDPRMRQICSAEYSVTVSCFVPKPWTTRGEAQEIRDQAAARGWNHIIVVTYAPHIARARYIVGKCFDGEITMVESPWRQGFLGWVTSYAYQTGGFIKAAFESGC